MTGSFPSWGESRVILPGDGSDGTAILEAALAAVSGSAESSAQVVVSTTTGAPAYLAGTVHLQTSYTTLTFASPLTMGPAGQIRMWGKTEEVPSSSFPHLNANVSASASTIVIDTSGNLAYFSVGDSIRIRGQRDSDGDVLTGEYNTITAINTGTRTLTLGTATANAYTVSYTDTPNGTYYTEITRLTSRKLTADAARGDRTVTLTSVTGFAAGDLVELADTALSASGNPYHLEQALLASVNSGASTVTLSRPLSHAYPTAAAATVTKVSPVVRSTLTGASMTWTAQGADYPIWLRYTQDCALLDCSASSAAGESWTDHAYRIDHSYGAVIRNVRAYRPLHTGAGQGYGVGLYSCTLCQVEDGHFAGCRHGVLLFQGACANTVRGNLITDSAISGVDLHGCEEADNLVVGNHIEGGDTAAGDGSTLKAALKAGNPTHDIGSIYNVFASNTVVNLTGTGAAFEVDSRSRDTVFRDNTIMGAAIGLRIPVNSGHTTYTAQNTVVEGNTLLDVATLASADGGSSAIIAGLSFDRNRIVRATGPLTIANASGVRIRNNVWDAPAISSGPAITLTAITGPLVAGNDLSGVARGISLTTCPAAKLIRNILLGLSTAYWAVDDGASANWVGVSNSVDAGATVTGSASTGRYICNDLDAYVPDTPGEHGLVDWNFPPDGVTATSAAPTAGVIHISRVVSRSGAPFSKVVLHVGTAGSSLANCYVAALDAAGNRLAVSADVSTTLQSTGVAHLALGSTVTPSYRGQVLYAAILCGSGTMPQLARGPASIGPPNTGLVAATTGLRYGSVGTSQTSIGTTVSVSTAATTTPIQPWVALEP